MSNATIISMLAEILDIMDEYNNHDFRSGVKALIRELDNENIDGARSIYASMTKGSGSFSEFNVGIANTEIDAPINDRISVIQSALWNSLGVRTHT